MQNNHLCQHYQCNSTMLAPNSKLEENQEEGTGANKAKLISEEKFEKSLSRLNYRWVPLKADFLGA